MKINVDSIRKVGNRYYILPSKKDEPMLSLNETAKTIIENLSKGKTVDEITNVIIKEYNADELTVRDDVMNIIQQLESLNIIY